MKHLLPATILALSFIATGCQSMPQFSAEARAAEAELARQEVVERRAELERRNTAIQRAENKRRMEASLRIVEARDNARKVWKIWADYNSFTQSKTRYKLTSLDAGVQVICHASPDYGFKYTFKVDSSIYTTGVASMQYKIDNASPVTIKGHDGYRAFKSITLYPTERQVMTFLKNIRDSKSVIFGDMNYGLVYTKADVTRLDPTVIDKFISNCESIKL